MGVSRFLLAALVLAGCARTEPSGGADNVISAADESACLAAVAEKTANSVALISSRGSGGTNAVIVAVGPDRAPWRCEVSGGRVAGVMSLADEGAL